MNTDGWVAIDGELVDPARASISVFDRGFLYGDAVFETMRCYGEEPFRLEEHIERLFWSAGQLRFVPKIDKAQLATELRALFAQVRSQSSAQDHTIRVMLTRGIGPFGLDPSACDDGRRVVFVRQLAPPSLSAYRDGVTAISYATHRPSDAAAGAKLANYTESILALSQARDRDAHEALIVGHDGQVIEGTTSNVFMIKDGALETPPTYETLLPGITRRLSLEVARECDVPVIERRLTVLDLAQADELWLTSTVRELLPVVELDGHRIGDGKPGPIGRRIHQALREREKLTGPLPWIG